jgi:tRNA threonylcarbamoyladenosine biosynthesis protein TsaE
VSDPRAPERTRTTARANDDGETVTIATTTPEDTEAVARRLGAAAAPGDVVALVGPLGAGKTAFVRGLATGLGIDPDDVASPTFTMVAEYRAGRLPLFHVDLYRLDPAETDMLPLREYAYGTGVTAIEWFDRLPDRALDAYVLVRIEYAEPGRVLHVSAQGARAASLLGVLTGD